jgi:hypothetical protein
VEIGMDDTVVVEVLERHEKLTGKLDEKRIG